MSFEGTAITLPQGFWMAKYLVTQAQYQLVMDENPSGFVGGSLPVESVFKGEAMTFARKLTDVERAAGRLPQSWEYRLPTEAQWEYACRATTTTAYSFGEDPGLLDDYAWYRDNSGDKTHEVGQKKANPWGLYDMHGNCLEFVRDAYIVELPGGTDPEVTSLDLPTRPDESEEPFAVGRGGGWFFPAAGVQSAVRSRLGARDRGYQLGFRVALVRSPGVRSARPGEIEGLVEKYLAAFREAKYADAVAMMSPDLKVYAPYGFLQGVPENKSGVLDVYKQLHAQGLRLNLTSEDIRVVEYGEVAVATFITKGTWWVPPREPDVTRRVTQVWSKMEGQWMVSHGHHSDYREEP